MGPFLQINFAKRAKIKTLRPGVKKLRELGKSDTENDMKEYVGVNIQLHRF